MPQWINPNRVYADQMASQAVGLAGQFVDAYNKAEEERVRSSLIKMQNKYDSDQNELLIQLQQTTDLEEIDKLTNTFTDNVKNGFTNKESSYYCQTEFEAKKANEMLERQNVALQGKVAMRKLELTQDKTMANYSECLDMNNKSLYGQDLIDANTQMIEQMYNSNLIDANKRSAMIAANTKFAIQKDYSKKEREAIEEAIATGKDLNYVYLKLNADESVYTYKGTNGESLIADKKSIYEENRNGTEAKYRTALNEYQSKNDSSMANTYSSMMNGKSAETQVQMCEQALRVLDSWRGNQLDAQRKTYWVDKFTKDLDTLKKCGSLNITKSTNPDSYATYIKNQPDTFLTAVQEGNLSDFQAARDQLNQVMYNDFMNNDWKETKGMTKEEKQDYWNKNYSNFATQKILSSEVLTKVLRNTPELADVNRKFEDLKKDIQKNPDKYSSESLSYISGFVMDAVAHSGANTDFAALSKELDTQLNLITISKVNKLYSNKEFNNIAGNDKQLKESVDFVNNNDNVYTNINGKEVWAPGTKEKTDEIQKQQAAVIARSFGKDIDDIIKDNPQAVGYMNTKDDKKPITEVEINGKAYHLENDENGNTVIKDRSGKTYNVVTAKDMNARDKKVNQQNKQEKKAVKQEEKKIVEEQQTKAAQMTYKNLPEELKNKVSESQFYSYTPTEKYTFLLNNGYFK